MAYHPKTRLSSAIGLALLLLASSGGCVVLEDSGLPVRGASCGPATRQIAHPGQVCRMDPVFYGYHATCWQNWPEGWTECPSPGGTIPELEPAAVDEAAMDQANRLPIGEPPLFEAEPVAPDSSEWQIIRVSDRLASERQDETDSASEPPQTSTLDNKGPAAESSPQPAQQLPSNEDGAEPLQPIEPEQHQALRRLRLTPTSVPDAVPTARPQQANARGLDAGGEIYVELSTNLADPSCDFMPTAPVPGELLMFTVRRAVETAPSERGGKPAEGDLAVDHPAGFASSSAPARLRPAQVELLEAAPLKSSRPPALASEAESEQVRGWVICSDEDGPGHS